MPHYYFDVRNGRRHKDSLVLDCRDDKGAIAKAKFFATQIDIDTPQLNHRHVVVLNDAGDEILETPVRSNRLFTECTAGARWADGTHHTPSSLFKWRTLPRKEKHHELRRI